MDDIADLETAKAVAETLTKHYGRHLWAVSWQGGVVVVRVPSLHGDWGFVINPRTVSTASELARLAIMAGGELLERAGVSRSRTATSYDRILD